MSMQPTSSPGAGFASPVIAAQSVFRAVMNAMARPGLVETLPDVVPGVAAMSCGVAAIVLALTDHDAPVWLDAKLSETRDVADWIRFRTGAPIVVDPEQSAFALIAEGAAMPDLASFALGTDEYPDRSTTLVIQVSDLTDGSPLTLSGPGIQGNSICRAQALPANIAGQLKANRALFPRGVDLILACGAQIVAIPRSTRVDAQGA